MNIHELKLRGILQHFFNNIPSTTTNTYPQQTNMNKFFQHIKNHKKIHERATNKVFREASNVIIMQKGFNEIFLHEHSSESSVRSCKMKRMEFLDSSR
jgi:hypothetical protein